MVKRLERNDFAVHSRLMLRQAVWCGSLFALTAILLVLNLLPAVDVQYQVSSKVLITPTRVEGLVRNLKLATNWLDSARLRDFRVLDRTDQGVRSPSDFQSSELVLLSLQSLWTERCTRVDFESWLDRITRPDPLQSRDSTTAADLRLARWELALAEHYQAHHDFLADAAEAAAPAEQAFQLAGTSPTAPRGQLVSRPLAGRVPQDDRSDLNRQLSPDVVTARARVEEAQTAQQSSLDRSFGQLSITDSPTTLPLAAPVPLWMAASVLILGLATGTSLGWWHTRLQSGGVFEPEVVADQLASRGLTIAAHLAIGGEDSEAGDWLDIASRQAVGAGRFTARHLIGVGEWLVGGWCLLIAGRVILDPLWRSVLLDSPLAALGRLISGLP